MSADVETNELLEQEIGSLDINQVEQDSNNEIGEEEHLDPDVGPAPPGTTKHAVAFESNDLPYEIINGIPCYQPDHVIDNHIQVYERIGWDDNVGATYLGLGPDGKELVLRVAPAEAAAHIVRMEAAFLCKAEAENEWRHFSQVHQIWQTDDAFHMTVFFRGGPALDQCFDFRKRQFTYGTAGRLAFDILQIIRSAHNLGYLLRSVDLQNFHFDAAGRHLFMADISSLIKDISKLAMQNSAFKIAPSTAVPYVGSLDFAPVSHHRQEGTSERGDLESWLYLFIYMTRGTLPWQSLPFDEVSIAKMQAVSTGELFNDLPEQFSLLNSIINEKPSSVPVTKDEYEELEKLTTEIFRDVGGVHDHEENFDFEREPTAEELPRFVLVRDEVNADSEAKEVKDERST